MDKTREIINAILHSRNKRRENNKNIREQIRLVNNQEKSNAKSSDHVSGYRNHKSQR